MTIIRKEDLSEATHKLEGGERVRIAARRDQMSEEVISRRLRLPREHGMT